MSFLRDFRALLAGISALDFVMAKELENKVAIVTGGGQGIGRGIVMKLLARGMRVVIADKDDDAAAEAADELGTNAPERVFGIQTDVADETSVRDMVAETFASYGQIDLLVNNAGHGTKEPTPVEELTLAEWNRVLGTNLTGTFLCSKHAVPHLRKQRGAIVNIASTRALQSEVDTEAYAASKGGIVAITHALAISLGPEVRVNCISPGWIVVDEWQKRSERKAPMLRPEDHAQHPAGRVGHPEDIAEMVAYLGSERAGFITGQNFVIDGGMTRKMVYEK
jgi:NAD(P)-dependent dehydrogenase (short-subunit alcohol dehydrogenase family)